nr:helicase-related protein [Thiothrix subterranea]
MATTVIEVGVDVPNASLMVIENAERMGLSQLHQLRGRVGRGSVASSCVLLYQHPLGKTARKRLDAMRTTTDGFMIADIDLELRGPARCWERARRGMCGCGLRVCCAISICCQRCKQPRERWWRITQSGWKR